MTLSTSFTQISKGNDYPYIQGANLPKVDEFVFLKDIVWKKQQLDFMIEYAIVNNMSMTIGLSKSIITTKEADNQTAQYYLDKYTSPFEQGNHFVVITGLTIGL